MTPTFTGLKNRPLSILFIYLLAIDTYIFLNSSCHPGLTDLTWRPFAKSSRYILPFPFLLVFVGVLGGVWQRDSRKLVNNLDQLNPFQAE